MAGVKTDAHSKQEMREVYVDNLKYASRKLGEHDIMALIEPINTRLSVPGYFLNNVDEGKYLLLAPCIHML